MPAWNKKTETVWATANTSKTITFAEGTPASTDLIVVILRLAQTAAPTSTPSGLTLRDSHQNGTNWVGIYTRQGNGSVNSFTFGTASITGAAVVMAFPGYTQATLERTGVKLNISNSGTKNIVDLTTGTAGANTVVLAVASLTSNPTSWGTWSNGYDTATATATSGLSVGVKAFAAAGITDVDTSITNSPNRTGSTVAWVIYAGGIVNIAPTVSLGLDRNEYEDQTITVHATASDSDGTIASYAWSVIYSDLLAPTLSGATTADVSFTPDRPQTVILRCTVTDNGGKTAFDDIKITVRPDQDLRSAYRGVTKPRMKNKGISSIELKYKGVRMTPELGLISEWNFSEANAPFYNHQGALPLWNGDFIEVEKSVTPWGDGVSFSGGPYLAINMEDQGALNLGLTQQVTVAAWVKRTAVGPGFIAGAWSEDLADPRRCYGLQIDEDEYGGANRSIFRISKYGESSPGYDPENIDYSAHPTVVTNNVWQFHVGTYDGSYIRSYLNGNYTTYLNYTDAFSNTYDRNPYQFGNGINDVPCIFSVGSSYSPEGQANFLIGEIAKLRVWDRALSAGEIAYLYAQEIPGI